LQLVPLSRSHRRLVRRLRSWRDCSRFGSLTGATEPGGKLGWLSEAAPPAAHGPIKLNAYSGHDLIKDESA
jgi:hypothetical protein